MGGSWRMRPTEVTSSGVVSVQSRQAVSTRSERSQGQISQPAKTSSSGKSSNSIAVTTPKLPPPPRSAKKRSRLVGVVDAVELAVGGDELDRRDGVRGEAVLAGEPAHAAAERVARDADVRRGAVQRTRPCSAAGVTTSSQRDAGADAGLPSLGVDLRRRAARACAPARRRRDRRATRRRGRCPAGPRAGRCPWRSGRPPGRRRSWWARRSARGAARTRRSKAFARRPSLRPRGRGPSRGQLDAE